MKKVTVVYMIDTLLKLAGSERNLYEIVTRLNKDRYRPIVLCHRGGHALCEMQRQGIEAYDMGIRKIYSPAALIKAVKLWGFLMRQKVDLLVTYHESSDFYGLLIGKLARIPVIISSRRDMGYGLNSKHIWLYRKINKYFDAIITVSNAVKEVVSEREKTPWHKMVTVYNGVELSKFESKTDVSALKHSLGLEPSWPIVGILAVVRPIKGHVYFIEAAARVLRTYPNTYFIAAGWNNDTPYYRSLLEKIRQLGIEKNILFIGNRDSNEALSLIDISVFSSINEGFSNAVVESMAAGKPVIATKAGGTPEAVQGEETGILVEPKNSKALAEAIERLLHMPKEAKSMGAKGRKRAQALFGIDLMMATIDGLYNRLLSEKIMQRNGQASESSFRLTKVIKGFVSGILYYSGICHAIRKRQNHQIKILAYHRVGRNTSIRGMSITPGHFEEQLKYLKSNYSVISLDEAVRALRREREMPRNAIVITFDDGYRDNMLSALPILVRYGIPATIFITVEAVEKRSNLWFDIISDAFYKSKNNVLHLGRYQLPDFMLDTPGQRKRAQEAVIAFGKLLSRKNRDQFVNEVTRELGYNRKMEKNDGEMLTWNDIARMQHQGITFGSHGMSHTILTALTKEEAEYEVAESKKIIYKRTGINVNTFAYPNGSEHDFNKITTQLLHHYGYTAACTLVKGNNYVNADMFTLRRICISQGIDESMFGKYSRSVFAMEMSDIYQGLRNTLNQ